MVDLGAVVYCGLVALLGFGAAAAVRHSGAVITAALAALYVTPIAAQFVTDPQWHARIERYSPMTAGLRPWAGVAVRVHRLVTTVWRGA